MTTLCNRNARLPLLAVAAALLLPGVGMAMPGMKPDAKPDAAAQGGATQVTCPVTGQTFAVGEDGQMVPVESAGQGSSEPESPATAPERVTLWLDMYRAEPLPFANVLEDLGTVDVVYVGETHTLKRHHQWQAEILESLIEARDGKLVLGLEQIEQFYQPQVDRFNAGKIDFDELAKEIDWRRRWSNYEDYRPLLELAQSKGVPVLALNGRAETIRKVGRKGLDSLDRDERKELPRQMNFDDPDYRRLLDQLMMVHASVDESVLDRIFQAQVARDENMAQALADFLEKNPGYAAMVVAGSGHLAYGLGTVDRVRARLPELEDRIVLMTVSGELVLSEQQEKMARPVTITHGDLRYLRRPKADYLQLTEPEE